jgi:hypothetical protein
MDVPYPITKESEHYMAGLHFDCLFVISTKGRNLTLPADATAKISRFARNDKKYGTYSNYVRLVSCFY